MKYLPELTALACALALAVPVVPAHAGEDVNSSEFYAVSTSVAVSLIVASPFLLASQGVQKLQEASAGSNHHRPKSRHSADDDIPDMNVKEVDRDENGDPRVHLEVPDNPEHTITLIWHGREDNPAAGFREGARIAFQPSPQASGWLLRDDTGTALGFIPVLDNAAENHSALF